MKHSAFFKWNRQDFFKGLIMAVGGAIYSVVQTSISAKVFTFDLTSIWHTALAAAIVYLGKNLLTPTPASIFIDPSKTSVIDSTTNNPLIKTN